ncbi:MAG: SH3 domain-containing protein [Devosia sp.]
MRNATKRLIIRIATAVALASATAVVLLPSAASAATSATATASVAVRERPTTSSDRVDTLYAGESVTVEGCRSGWCYVTHSGPDGFVSASYLRAGSAMISPNFNLSFNFPQGSFSIGNGGVSIGIGSGNSDGEDFAQACFYSGSGYTGSRICLEEGESIRSLPSSWNDRISSIRNPDGLRITVCQDRGYFDCRTYTTSARYLGGFNNEISSIRVR